MFTTVILLLNSLRLTRSVMSNEVWFGGAQFSDIVVNSLAFFFATQALQSLSALPMQVCLTCIIPQNVEAAFTAFINSTYVFCFEVGCKMSGSLFCYYFNVNNDSLDRYWIVLVAKIPCIMLTMMFTYIIPRNEEIRELGKRLK